MYSQVDVFVFPSLLEGFGIPILEAMTARVPVVTSDLSALVEVAGNHAFLCDPYDPMSVAVAIQKAHSLPLGERRAFLENAARWASEYTWKRSADLLAPVIRSAVERKREYFQHIDDSQR
jgi:glycosyltransferase involved in cell wall biosynthesis